MCRRKTRFFQKGVRGLAILLIFVLGSQLSLYSQELNKTFFIENENASEKYVHLMQSPTILLGRDTIVERFFFYGDQDSFVKALEKEPGFEFEVLREGFLELLEIFDKDSPVEMVVFFKEGKVMVYVFDESRRNNFRYLSYFISDIKDSEYSANDLAAFLDEGGYLLKYRNSTYYLEELSTANLQFIVNRRLLTGATGISSQGNDLYLDVSQSDLTYVVEFPRDTFKISTNKSKEGGMTFYLRRNTDDGIEDYKNGSISSRLLDDVNLLVEKDKKLFSLLEEESAGVVFRPLEAVSDFWLSSDGDLLVDAGDVYVIYTVKNFFSPFIQVDKNQVRRAVELYNDASVYDFFLKAVDRRNASIDFLGINKGLSRWNFLISLKEN